MDLSSTQTTSKKQRSPVKVASVVVFKRPAMIIVNCYIKPE
jgi:hypothetical protein